MAGVEITDLYIYPVKSCAGVRVQALSFDHQGPVDDRRYMVVKPDGHFLTQRQLPAMAHIQCKLLESGLELSFSGVESCRVSVAEVQAAAIRLTVSVWGDEVEALDCGDEIAVFLNGVLGCEARLVYMPESTHRQVDASRAKEGEWVGFADGFPLLLCAEESLQSLSEEAGLDVDMLRFRPNVVVRGGQPFEELDWTALKSASGQLQLLKPCTRCVIPTRDIDSQQKQPAVVAALKKLCMRDKQILFGQNAVLSGLDSLRIGDRFESCEG